VAFSPDGKTIATAGWDGARLWDAATLRPIGTPLPHPHPSPVEAVAFSPDGKTIATAGWDGARLWDAATARLIGTPLPHPSRCEAVAFSPDGKILATAGWDGARLWDAATLKPIGAPLPHPSLVEAVAFSPDGRTIATAGSGGARLWDAATARPIGTSLSPVSAVRAVAFNDIQSRLRYTAEGSPASAVRALASGRAPDEFLAISSWDNTARLRDVATARPIGAPLPLQSEVQAVAFDPSLSRIATASRDNTVRLWDAATSTPIGPPLQHPSPVQALAFSRDNQSFATASRDNTVRPWDLITARPLDPPLQHPSPVQALAFSPNCKILATAGIDGARLWDAATLKPIGATLPHPSAVEVVAFSPNSKVVATASQDKTVRLWDAAALKPIGAPLQHPSAVEVVAFSGDSKVVATASQDKTVRLWDAAALKPIGAPLQHPSAVQAMTFLALDRQAMAFLGRPYTRTLATVSRDNTARLWDAATSRPIGAPLSLESLFHQAVGFSSDGKIVLRTSRYSTEALLNAGRTERVGPRQPHSGGGLAVSPDAKTVIVPGGDNTVRLQTAAQTGPDGMPQKPRPVGMPLHHPSPVQFAAFSPDGRIIATADSDNTVRLWDAATSTPIGPPLQHPSPVRALAFSPDGQTLATAGLNKTWLWDVPDPMEGDPDQIALWTQLRSNMKLDENDTARALGDWEREPLRRRIDKLGGLPSQVDRDPEPEIAWHQREAESSEQSRQWFAAHWHLDRLIAATRADGSLYARRGAARAHLGRWAEADADFVKAIECGGDSSCWVAHALLRLPLGDIEGYRKACEQMREKFEEADDPDTANAVAMACDGAPHAVADLSYPVRLAERAAASDPKNPTYLETLGASLFRAGRFEEALERLDEAARLGQDLQDAACNWIFRGMAHHHLGHTKEAREWLDQAVRWIDRDVSNDSGMSAIDTGFSRNQWLWLQFLRREAETLIKEGRPPDLPVNVSQDGPAPTRVISSPKR
jgi:WD40 repeat protein/Flp pilus assembly protein TadD